MGNSNRKIQRHKLAGLVEDEILTFETELTSIEFKLQKTNLSSLKLLSYEKLKKLRELVSELNSKINHVNRAIDEIAKPEKFVFNSIIPDGERVIMIDQSLLEDE